MRRIGAAALVLLLFVLAPAGLATANPSANVAALQVALRAQGLYRGTVDGLEGPATSAAVRAFQRRRGLIADGVVGPLTRGALGRRGRHLPGTRVLRTGLSGWDVAALQFRLGMRGFPCGPIDGGYGARTAAAVARVQAHAGVVADGIAGPATLQILATPPPRVPYALRRPVDAPIGDRFGPRENRFHSGVDFPAPYGRPVVAAAAGRVVSTGYDLDYGNTVLLDHFLGVRTRYAHLSTVAVRPGQAVVAGALVGRVGSTGRSTGPHLHFEVILRGATIDPAPALGL